MSIGGSNITTDGLIFSIDANNLKSYPMPIIAGTLSTVVASYSQFALNRVYDNTQQPIVIGIPGNVKSTWDGYQNTVNVYLSGGATSEIYGVDNAFYDASANVTVLYPNFTANYVTMSHTCSIGLDPWYYYQNSIQIGGIDLTGIFYAYGSYDGSFALNSPLSFDLSGGAIVETYNNVDLVYYDGVDTWLVSTAGPTIYNDHTLFKIVVPEITSTLYTDNITASYMQIIASTISYDLSSNHNNGYIINGFGVNSDSRYFILDGVDDYISTGIVVEPSSSSNLQSYCGWLKYSPGGYNSWFGTDASSGGQHHLVVLWSSYPTQIQVGGSYYGGGGGEGNNFATVTNTNSNGYDHVCYIKTAPYTYDLYLNSVLVMNGITKTSIYTSNFNLGRFYIGQSTKSQIPMVYVYNRALTTEEVRYNYEQTKWRFNSL